MNIRRERDQFRRVSAKVVSFNSGRARVDPHVAADHPAQFAEPLQKCRDADLVFLIVRHPWHEHTNTPNALHLLRARRERPRHRRAAEQRDELAPSHHSITLSAMASSPGGTSMSSARAV
jgi:hypothetical protein